MPSPNGARPHLRRRLRPTAAALVALLAALPLAVAPAGAEPKLDDLRAKRADVAAKKAKVAAGVDALKADQAEVAASLDALAQDVGSQSAAMLQADAAAQRARGEAQKAREALALADTALQAAEASLKRAAVSAYTRGPAGPTPQIDAGDLNSVGRAQAYGALATGQRTDALDQLTAARRDREAAQRRLQSASKVADDRLLAAQARLRALNEAKARQLGYADAVSDRLDRTLAEAQGLAQLDAGLASEITKQEAALAARLAAAKPRPRPAAAGGGGGGAISIVGDGDIVSVRGIRVARSIADDLARMLSAADGAGINLTGGGYRSSQGQIETRKNNCGTSHYAIYQAPASSCSPPTARPGQSMHEKGLAIDFQCNGALIQSRSNPCFQWLSRNAGGYGFYNLPSEPWHWSTNGN